jgi:hypothetical protein
MLGNVGSIGEASAEDRSDDQGDGDNASRSVRSASGSVCRVHELQIAGKTTRRQEKATQRLAHVRICFARNGARVGNDGVFGV